MSRQGSPKTSSSGSAPEYIKGVEKLIDSDEDEKVVHKMTELQKHFPILKKMLQFLTNGEKVNLFLRDHNFRNRLSHKLKEQGILNAHPILKVQLYSIRYHSVFQDQLDDQDLWEAFSKFGNVTNLYCDKRFAYIQFNDYSAAYIAIKVLNDFPLQGQALRISVRWAEQLQENQSALNCFMALPQFQSVSGEFISVTPATLGHANNQKPKYTCQYQICLDQYPQFKTAQKIIGPKGLYMKRIIEKTASSRGADVSSIEKLVKIRLRGKGSGYRQGPNSVESDQNLNLCVSCREQQVYVAVCIEVERLLWKVSEDYKFHAQKQSKKAIEGIAYKKVQFTRENEQETKRLTFEQLEGNYELVDQISGVKITQKEINNIINNRQEARKCGNYRAADQLRNYLKKRGVIIIDEKGGKGKQKRTKWKFIDQ